MLKQISHGIGEGELDRVCPCCGSSKETIRRAWGFNRFTTKQIYYCKKCKIKFRGTCGFAKMKKEPQAIILALDLFFKGLSLRKITEHLHSIYGIDASHVTIYNWIGKYVKLIKKYVASQDPTRLSTRWHADETIIKLKGSHINMWALLDDQIKLLIASHISESRGTSEAQTLFEKGIRTSKRLPTEVVTDGLSSYQTALEKVAKKHKASIIHLEGPFIKSPNNNLIERFFGTVKERTKQFRGLNNQATAEKFAEGFSIYYNRIRSHSSIDGRPPAEVAGLQPKLGNNKWLHLIRLASKMNGRALVKKRLQLSCGS
jgi:transposase-like protein